MKVDSARQVFLVDWVLPTTSLADLHAAQHALEEASRRVAADGEPVQCLRSTYVPAQRRWLCLFAADSIDAVRRTHEIAQIPVRHIEEVVDLTLREQPSA